MITDSVYAAVFPTVLDKCLIGIHNPTLPVFLQRTNSGSVS